MELFTKSISMLEKGLDYSALKQKTIAQNIANVDVPNYKRQNVSFKKYMDVATENLLDINYSHQKHIEIQPKLSSRSLYEIQNQKYFHNGNNVDIDKEMSELATNQIYNQALVDRLNGKFSTLQTVIRGGK